MARGQYEPDIRAHVAMLANRARDVYMSARPKSPRERDAYAQYRGHVAWLEGTR